MPVLGEQGLISPTPPVLSVDAYVRTHGQSRDNQRKRGWPWALQFAWKTRKFRGVFKWNSSSRWIFSGKKVIPFEVLLISRFYRNDRNFLYHLSGLPVLGFKTRESEKFTGIFKWYNSIPFLFSVPKNIPVPFDGNFSPKFPYKW